MYARFIARQPIIDGKQNLTGYELLSSAMKDNYAGADRKATSQLIVSSTTLFHSNTLLDGTRAYINFGAVEIVSGGSRLLPSARTVVEVPSKPEFTGEVIQGLKTLRTSGYRLALDRYEGQARGDQVPRYTNFVKVGFRESHEADQATIKRLLADSEIKLTAKKVKT